MNPGPPALEASTIPLGYREGGNYVMKDELKWISMRERVNIKYNGNLLEHFPFETLNITTCLLALSRLLFTLICPNVQHIETVLAFMFSFFAFQLKLSVFIYMYIFGAYLGVYYLSLYMFLFECNILDSMNEKKTF